MLRRFFFTITFLFFVLLLFSQRRDVHDFSYAKELYSAKQYSLVHQICLKVYENEAINDRQKENALYFIALSSKEMFNDDAKYWLEQFLIEYPYSLRVNSINYELALYYFRNANYQKAISYFLTCRSELDEYNFKLAYSYFVIDSIESAKYYYSRLLNKDSKYASTSLYFYAHIAYKQKHYTTALSSFLSLKDDNNFASIIPYYISQIYFSQKRYDELISYAKPMLNQVIASREAELNRMIAEAYYRKKDYINSVNYFEVFFSKSTKISSTDYLQIGHSYHNIKDFDNSIKYLEKIKTFSDSTKQIQAYYLANSYLNIDAKNYALESFKEAAQYDYNKPLQEDAFFNYAKLSYELDLPFENTLDVLNSYLKIYNHSVHEHEIQSLMINALQNTSRYEQAFEALKNIKFPSVEQKGAIQRLSFYLGVKAFNNKDYNKAILLLENSNIYKINQEILAMSTYWLGDCFYNIGNYKESIETYNIFLSYSLLSPSSFVYYNLGYAYFKQKEYRKAKNNFRKFTKISQDSSYLNDALLRTADCYYMLSEFSMAEKNYNSAIEYALFDTDYAIYNRSVCLGLIGKNATKVKLLNVIENNFKESAYYDDALLDLADHYKNTGKTSLAISYYDSLSVHTEDIETQARVNVHKGMIHLNMNNVDAAIQSFMVVIDNYVKTNYFKEALSGLQTAYISIAKVDEYLRLVNKLPNVNISRVEQDSLTYNTAFMKFVEGDYYIAKSSFKQYIDNFKEGIFIDDARYYLAESCVNLKDTSCALNNFKFITTDGIKHKELSLIFLARHYFSKNDFKKSNKYYLELQKIASNNSIRRELIIRLMYGFENKEDDQSVLYASRVLELDKVDENLINKASIILARSYFEQGNFKKAEKKFYQIAGSTKDKVGSEAMYMNAYLRYVDDSLQEAETLIYKLADEFTADYWIAKGFILLSDIYLQGGNDFQAKATLQSIIDNYEGEDLLIIARKKWESILAKEVVEIKTINQETYINIFDGKINYEVLFEEENDTTEL